MIEPIRQRGGGADNGICGSDLRSGFAFFDEKVFILFDIVNIGVTWFDIPFFFGGVGADKGRINNQRIVAEEVAWYMNLVSSAEKRMFWILWSNTGSSFFGMAAF